MSNTDHVVRRYMSNIDSTIKSYLPMSEQGFLLLYSLLEERHGYGIMQYAQQITDGRVNMGAGTVYTMLYKMENDHVVEVAREEERRKVYRITEVGLAVLKAEAARISGLATLAQDIAQKTPVKV